MAYLARIEPFDGGVLDADSPAAAGAPAFSDLEWSVIRLARIDALWTIRPAGRLRRAWIWLTGRPNPALANPQLEALRQMAVLSWHYGFTVPGEAVAEFESAGFTIAQYELLVTSIASAIRSANPHTSEASV